MPIITCAATPSFQHALRLASIFWSRRPPFRRSSLMSEHAAINRAGAAYFGGILGIEFLAKRFIRLGIPDLLHAVFDHVPEIGPVRRGHHAARHRLAVAAHISAGPRPLTALAARRSSDVRARTGA